MKETDLRVLKTKNTIQQCFFELLKKKPYEEISIKELCDMARCSRNTFYVHYQYKDNLYEQIIEACISGVLHGFRPLASRISEQTEEIVNQYIDNIMEGISNYAEILRLMINRDTNGSFQARLTKKMVDAMVLLSEQTSGLPANSDEWKLICHYNAGAVVGFVMFWLQTPDISIAQAKMILRDLFGPSMNLGEKYLAGN